VKIGNYESLEKIPKLYQELKDTIKYTLSEFLKISGKYDHNDDFLRETMKIFEQYQNEFEDSYNNFLEISKVTNENFVSWKHFPRLYEETKDKSNMTAV